MTDTQVGYASVIRASGIDVTAERSSLERGTRVGRLLLAEDNLINQKVAVAVLSSVGYLVDTVLTGAAAVKRRPADSMT